MTAALETVDLNRSFGGIVASANVSLRLEPGVRHALIGPNGAGKTTLVNLLSGSLRPGSGRVLLGGRDITALPRHRRARLGLRRTFQINQLFPSLSPLETIVLAINERKRAGATWWQRTGRDGATVDEAADLLARFGLMDFAAVETASLSYGRPRLLEIAVAVAGQPTVLLIEHDMDLVFAFAERISVLVGGAILAEGTPDAIRSDPRVRAAYLGEGDRG
jgi:branched-chain amino acid transport system ATP-binding protein